MGRDASLKCKDGEASPRKVWCFLGFWDHQTVDFWRRWSFCSSRCVVLFPVPDLGSCLGDLSAMVRPHVLAFRDICMFRR
jgi:hypothetical protein